MKGLITGVIVSSLCLGSTLAMATTYKSMWVQSRNGDKVRVLVPSHQVKFIKGQTVTLYELRGGKPLINDKEYTKKTTD